MQFALNQFADEIFCWQIISLTKRFADNSPDECTCRLCCDDMCHTCKPHAKTVTTITQKRDSYSIGSVHSGIRGHSHGRLSSRVPLSTWWNSYKSSLENVAIATALQLEAGRRRANRSGLWAVFVGLLRMYTVTDCYFAASDENSDIAIRFTERPWFYITLHYISYLF